MIVRDSRLDGRAIRIGRAMCGLSQRELADVAGMASWRLWRLENEQALPREEEIAALLRVLSTGVQRSPR